MKNTASRCRGYFYPRSPCGERRLSYFYIIKITQFLSTLSLRRATIPDREPAAGYLISIHALLAESDPTRWAPTCRISNFYPRSPCGERRRVGVIQFHPIFISIHALLAESDPELSDEEKELALFLSTLSLRRATLYLEENYGLTSEFLSTLSLRRATIPELSAGQAEWYFYPRSPCGERPVPGAFLFIRRSISIHALLAESDWL